MKHDQIDDILEEREKTHGDFGHVALISQKLKVAMASAECDTLSVVQAEALEMIAMKIARILAGDSNTKDHWEDIGGYARLVSRKL